MTLYAEVAVEGARGSERSTYTYLVPDGVDVVPGHRVVVPFGRRLVFGFVVSLDTVDPGIPVRPIERADRDALLIPHQLEVARAMADHYWVPLIECIRAMLPPRVRTARRSSGAGPSDRQTRHSRLLERAAQPATPVAPAALTPEQESARTAVLAGPMTLLHGITGSGKTEVYLSAAQATVEAGRRVLVLVPEISLTPQLVGRFAERFGGRMAVMTSALSELERAQQWWKARRGEVDLVIGSRSAVFAPLPRLGLVIVDEAGSSAYKQDRTPRYEAGWVARRVARSTGARLVYGTATPPVELYHATTTGNMQLARLSHRHSGNPPIIELVDLRAEVESGNRQPVSRRLQEVVATALREGGQAILFLNRRGLSSAIACADCGTAVQCPGCSVAMVHHGELGGLACHYCGYVRPVPPACPACGSRQIRALGFGTQRLETLSRKLWPGVKVLRLDSDSAGREGFLEIYDEFAEGRADILIGTQMVARGLDLPNVAAVGVVQADLPLYFPDYRAAENAYSMVTQVAGRAGRGRRSAHVVVQTWNPEHHAFQRALDGDYLGFYRAEIPSRQVFDFPPFGHLAMLTLSGADDDKVAADARDAAETLASGLVGAGVEGITVQGPAPAMIHRLRGEYRWQITLKGQGLERARPHLPRSRDWSIDVDPAG